MSSIINYYYFFFFENFQSYQILFVLVVRINRKDLEFLNDKKKEEERYTW